MAKKGFTMIELLVVIIIITTIAAFAIPALLRNRITANESSALASADAYYKQQMTYYYTRSQISGGTFYWTANVAGLYYLSPDGNTPIADLEKTLADSDALFKCQPPEGFKYAACSPGNFTPLPKNGYFTAVVTKYNNTPISTPQDPSKFGILLAPEIYDTTGTNVFLLTYKGEKFKSDASGCSALSTTSSSCTTGPIFVENQGYSSWSNINHPTDQTINAVGKPWIRCN
jgi:prepilin-type N-terminal cleavage/methylation domain-containing protein